MRKVELIVPEHDVVAVTEALAGLQVFHVVELDETEEEANEWTEKADNYLRLEQRVLDVMDVLGVEEGAPPEGPLHLISLDMAQREIDALEQEVRGPAQDMMTAREELTELRRIKNHLTPLQGLDVELASFRSTQYLFSMLGSMPVDNVERLETSLDPIPSVLVVLEEVNHLATVALFGAKRDAGILSRAARSAYLNPFELPESYEGTPAEVLAALDRRINQACGQIDECEAIVYHLHETRIQRLRQILWRVRVSRKLVETIAGFQQFQHTYLAVGWVPISDVNQLSTRIAEVSEDTIVEILRPTAQESEDVPFDFVNPPIVRMFERLVTTYGYPRYNELDPTPLIALTFPLIFGIMFGDVGHGLLLTALGLLMLSRKVEALRGVADFGGIIVACGFTSTVFGFLYGSFFGFEEVIPALWLHPLEQTTDVLVASVVLGAGVLILGMIYHIIDALITRRWGEALFDRYGLAGILFYAGLLSLGARLFNVQLPLGTEGLVVVVILSALAIAATEILSPLIEGGRLEVGTLGMTAAEGLFELFETILSLLSNTLSYVRMGAFAVAHGALSLVVFILARMVSSTEGVGYWVVVILGNFVVIGFEGMIVAIQTLRLEYYEFFSKFFSAGGERYSPLTLIPEERSP
jgi:V/A-type H+-transporting ATPase subunit I